MDTIKELREIRKEMTEKCGRYLFCLYKLVEGRPNRRVDIFKPSEKLGFDQDTTLEVVRRHRAAQWIKGEGSSGISITPLGIRAVEKVLDSYPEEE